MLRILTKEVLVCVYDKCGYKGLYYSPVFPRLSHDTTTSFDLAIENFEKPSFILTNVSAAFIQVLPHLAHNSFMGSWEDPRNEIARSTG